MAPIMAVAYIIVIHSMLFGDSMATLSPASHQARKLGCGHGIKVANATKLAGTVIM